MGGKPRGAFEKQMLLRRVINASQRITMLCSPAEPTFKEVLDWLKDEQIQIEGWTLARYASIIRQTVNGNHFTKPQYFGEDDEQGE